MNTGWWEIDIHGCYSLVKIAFAPICACKNNRRKWRHNDSLSRSRDVADQLWWRHNAKSEKTVLDDNCDMGDRWLFLEKLCVKDIKLRVRNKIIHSLPWITIFGSLVMRFTNDFHSWLRHSWKSLANRLTRDPKKSLFTVTHALFLKEIYAWSHPWDCTNLPFWSYCHEFLCWWLWQQVYGWQTMEWSARVCTEFFEYWVI